MEASPYSLRQKIGLFLGPLCCVIILGLSPPETLSIMAWKTLAVGILMASWWLTEAVPISVTSMVPLVLFPLLNIASIKAVSAPYANPLVYMFLAGFILASAMQRWNLHRRIALSIVTQMGPHPSRIILGFMLACALLSMWMNNTAVCMMMMPIGLSVIQIVYEKMKQESSDKSHIHFGVCLMLGIAYASSIGGLGTLIGSTPNALLAGFLFENYKYQLGFMDWMMIGLPLVVLLIPITWILLTKIIFPIKLKQIDQSYQQILLEKSKLGPMSSEESRVLLICVGTALMWMLQKPLHDLFPQMQINNTTVGMLGALLLFLIPLNFKKGHFILQKNWAKSIDWDILLLFGGGLSLASMIGKSGLAQWIGQSLSSFHHLPVFFVILLITLIIVFMTEVTSNTATAATFIPIMASLAVGVGENPLLYSLPIAFGATCAFMLPISTPPNAIVYSSGHLEIQQMIKAGFWLNLICILSISVLIYFVALGALGVQLGQLPSWVTP